MNKFDRRSFLQGSAAATVAAVGASIGPPLTAAPGPDLVDVSGGDPGQRVKAAFEALGGLQRFVRRGDKVAIKANLGFDRPADWGACTDPGVVEAVVRACLDAGAARVRVVEHPVSDPDKCLSRSGIGPVLDKLGVQAVMLAKRDQFKRVRIPYGKELKHTEVALDVLEADLLINIPVAKSHGSATVTFGLKNAMGLVWSRRPLHIVKDLHASIVDLGRVIRPQLTILDATRAMVTGGPRGPGDLEHPQRLVAGNNVVSVDAYGLRLARFHKRSIKPAEVTHIRLAAEAGLGRIDFDKLQIVQRSI